MSDIENQPVDDQQAIDPPEGQGGGGNAPAPMSLDGGQVQPIDVPEGDGGGPK